MIYYLDPREGAARRHRLTDWMRDLLSELSDDGRTRGLGQWRTPRHPGGHYGARADDIGGLEAANLESTSGRGRLGQAVALGLALAVWGLTRHGLLGLGVRAAGAGLVMSRLKESPGAPSITVEAPGALLAWRSEPGAVLENAGAVRFSREGTGTRLDLRFCYNPPTEAGAAVAALFGADPRAQLNQDLGRLKSLLESGTRSELYGQEHGA